MNHVRIQFPQPVSWAIFGSSTSEHFIVECERLGLVLEADTLDEAPSLMEEAVIALFESLLKEDDFDQFFTNQGWPREQWPIVSVPLLEHLPKHRLPPRMEVKFPPELVFQTTLAHAS